MMFGLNIAVVSRCHERETDEIPSNADTSVAAAGATKKEQALKFLRVKPIDVEENLAFKNWAVHHARMFVKQCACRTVEVVDFTSLMKIRHFIHEHASEASHFQETQGCRV